MNHKITYRNALKILDLNKNLVSLYEKEINSSLFSLLKLDDIIDVKHLNFLNKLSGLIKFSYSKEQIISELRNYINQDFKYYQKLTKEISSLLPLLIVKVTQDKCDIIHNTLVRHKNFLNKNICNIYQITELLEIDLFTSRKIIENIDSQIENNKKSLKCVAKLNDNIAYLNVSFYSFNNISTVIFRNITENILKQFENNDFEYYENISLDKIKLPIMVLNGQKTTYTNKHFRQTFSEIKNKLPDFVQMLKHYIITDNINQYISDFLTFVKSNDTVLQFSNIDLIDNNIHHYCNIDFVKHNNSRIVVSFNDVETVLSKTKAINTQRTLFDDGPVMILRYTYINDKKTLGWVSNNVEHFTGYTRDEFFQDNIDINELIPRKIFDRLIKEADDYQDSLQAKYTHEPYPFVKKNGETIWVKDHTKLIFDDENKLVGYYQYCIDVNDLMQIENQLKESMLKAETANRAKSVFLSNISHEIRTPLNAINGFTQLLIDVEKENDKLDKLNIIQAASNHLLGVISGILELSKIEQGNIEIKREKFALKKELKTLENMFRFLANNKNLKLKFDIHQNIPEYILTDRTHFNNIFINILTNAINYTEEGQITVSAYMLDNKKLRIQFSDTGIGIEKESLQSIFEEFHNFRNVNNNRRVTYGTGLGLAIVKKIANKLDCEVSVESEVGVGTTFFIDGSVIIPEHNKEEKNRQDHSSINNKISYDFSNLKILVAEDNKINQRLIKILFKKVNCNIDLANNGKETLEKLDNNQYDLLLLDIQMPVMDGEEVLKFLNKNDRINEIPIIALTAFAMIHEVKKYKEMGCVDLVPKPIDRNLLFSKIQNLFPNK